MDKAIRAPANFDWLAGAFMHIENNFHLCYNKFHYLYNFLPSKKGA